MTAFCLFLEEVKNEKQESEFYFFFENVECKDILLSTGKPCPNNGKIKNKLYIFIVTASLV